MEFSNDEKQTFFRLAQEKGYLTQEIILHWDFLPVEEFLENRYLEYAQYCEIIRAIKGENYQLPPPIEKEEEIKEEIEEETPTEVSSPPPAPKKIFIKKDKSFIHIQRSTLPQPSPPKFSDLANFRANKRQKWNQEWMDELSEDIKKRVEYNRRLSQLTFLRRIKNKEDRGKVIAITLAVFLVTFNLTLRACFFMLWFVAMCAGIVYYIRQTIDFHKNPILLAAIKNYRPPPKKRQDKEVTLEEKSLIPAAEKHVIEYLQNREQRLIAGGIVMVVLALATFSIAGKLLRGIFQLVIAFFMGVGTVRIIEKNKGYGGTFAFAGGLLCYLIVSDLMARGITSHLVLLWPGFVVGVMCFIMAATFGWILSTNIEISLENENKSAKHE